MRERRILFVILLLQFIPILLYPPQTLQAGLGVIGVVLLFFVLLGYGLWRGRIWAFTMSIFLQGLNIIIRLMMFFPAAHNPQTGWNVQLILFTLVAILLSGWIMLRLDKPDLRSLIVG
ncbi:MAG: hypothetical protein ACPL4H_03940 [Anaerolineales bacterium]